VSAALLASLVIFGPWPLRMTAVLPYARDLNQSWWPYSIPFGLGLGWLALRRRDKSLAMIAAPLLSPYVLYYAWAGALAGLLADGRRGWALAAVALADVVLIAYLIAVGP
jgi:hypothetical protein